MGRETRVVAGELHHQAALAVALQAQAAHVVVFRHDDLAAEHVHDVGIVPHGLGGERGRPDFHAVDFVDQQRVVDHAQTILADHRAIVVGIFFKVGKRAGTAPPVGHHRRLQRVGVDTDDRTAVAQERIVNNDRLGAAYENGGRFKLASAVAVAGKSGVVEFESGVGHPGLRLANLDR